MKNKNVMKKSNTVKLCGMCQWHFCSKTLSTNLQRVQNYAMKIKLRDHPEPVVMSASLYWAS